MKRVLPVLVLSLVVFALTPVFSASAVPTVVVRPGHLAGWVPTSGTKVSYGRWDTGPAKALLGQGSLHLLASTKDRLQMALSSPVNLAGFTASFAVNGSGYASFYVRAPGGASASMTPDSTSAWSKVNAMSYSNWQWDCDGNGSIDGNGRISSFRSDCSSSTVSAFGFKGTRGTSWVDAAKIGPAGNVKVYNFEPPTARISDAQVVEGNSGWRPMHFVVRLSGPNQDKAEVKFATSGLTKVRGRACACEDFSFNIAVLTIKARATSGVISIKIAGDTVHEPNETFTVRLSTHLNCFPTRAVGVGTIVNDDPAP